MFLIKIATFTYKLYPLYSNKFLLELPLPCMYDACIHHVCECVSRKQKDHYPNCNR